MRANARTTANSIGVGSAVFAVIITATATTAATITAAITMAAITATAMPPAATIGGVIRSVKTTTPSTHPYHANKLGCAWVQPAACSNPDVDAEGPI